MKPYAVTQDQDIILSGKRRPVQEEINRQIPHVCGKQQRCKCTTQVFGHCGCNKHDYQGMEGNLCHNYPELLSQSKLQTPLKGS